jgi:hypothetical protein
MLENTEAGKAIKTGPSIETGNMSRYTKEPKYLYTRMQATAKNYEIIDADTRYCTF